MDQQPWLWRISPAEDQTSSDQLKMSSYIQYINFGAMWTWSQILETIEEAPVAIAGQAPET